MTDEERLQAAAGGGHQEGAHGLQALNGASSPLEILLATERDPETEAAERRECREEAFRRGRLVGSSRLMSYLFADGRPDDASLVMAREYDYAQRVVPSLLDGVTVEEMTDLRRLRGSMSGEMPMGQLIDFRAEARDWAKGERWQREAREFFLAGAMEGQRGLMRYFFADGKPGEPVYAGRRTYSAAKGFYEDLIGGMSLEKMGEAFDEENPRGARARWSWRIRSFVNRALEESGAVAHLRFQKSAKTRAKYAAAAARTRNRARGRVCD